MISPFAAALAALMDTKLTKSNLDSSFASLPVITHVMALSRFVLPAPLRPLRIVKLLRELSNSISRFLCWRKFSK